MAKIFDVIRDTHESPNRNTFDLHHKRHMTGKGGYIYPILCQPVVPTDSFEIDTAIGANLLPMWYPTQSKMRFILHYFFVPYRIMQKNWKNQLEGLVQEDFPVMNVPSSYYKTSSLADYLGVPTNLVMPDDDFLSYPVVGHPNDNPKPPFKLLWTNVNFLNPANVGRPASQLGFSAWDEQESYSESYRYFTFPIYNITPLSFEEVYTFKVPFRTTGPLALKWAFHVFDAVEYNGTNANNPSTIDLSKLKYVGIYEHNSTEEFWTSDVSVTAEGNFWSVSFNGNILRTVITHFNELFSVCKVPVLFISCRPAASAYREDYFTYTSKVIQSSCPKGYSLDVATHPLYCPYDCSDNGLVNSDKIPISAFPFRAYDMIYQSYYRNSHGVQPFVVDGETKYNEYLRTDSDGADSNQYELHCRNWELDAYTSCMPSPQQGVAPVIGVNALGRMTITDPDGTTSTLDLIDTESDNGLEVRNADIATPEHARLATSLVSSGLSIADFRQANALQNFLEQSLRSGFRYADFIFGHFGKSPSHQELDMPIFLGGVTQVVDVSKISNVSASGDTPLGQFAGVGSSFSTGANHKISHYFDDYGLVIGLMMLVPDAAYSQILPKHFLYNSRLDFVFPQFTQLGLQPITYEEMCPIQSHYEYVKGDTSKLLTDVFGYQRPNHEYVWLPDTLHGLFRTSLNGSVISRRFGHRPYLGDEFLKIKPEEINDIFSVVEENDDIFIAQVDIDIKATRPLPRVVIPSLGR